MRAQNRLRGAGNKVRCLSDFAHAVQSLRLAFRGAGDRVDKIALAPRLNRRTVQAILPTFDDAKYPDLSGQWVAVRFPVGGQPAFDPTKAWGRSQQAPLTAEYQKVLEASLAEQARGNQGNWLSGVSCLPTGMPPMMTLYRPMEIIVLPDVTYIRIDHTHQSHRRIYTDGREWPKQDLV
jgi:hypothetical protein